MTPSCFYIACNLHSRELCAPCRKLSSDTFHNISLPFSIPPLCPTPSLVGSGSPLRRAPPAWGTRPKAVPTTAFADFSSGLPRTYLYARTTSGFQTSQHSQYSPMLLPTSHNLATLISCMRSPQSAHLQYNCFTGHTPNTHHTLAIRPRLSEVLHTNPGHACVGSHPQTTRVCIRPIALRLSTIYRI